MKKVSQHIALSGGFADAYEQQKAFREIRRLRRKVAKIKKRWRDYMGDGNNAVIFDKLAEEIQKT